MYFSCARYTNKRAYAASGRSLFLLFARKIKSSSHLVSFYHGIWGTALLPVFLTMKVAGIGSILYPYPFDKSDFGG